MTETKIGIVTVSDRASRGEYEEEFFLHPALVRDRAEYRRQQDDQQAGAGIGNPEWRGAVFGAGTGKPVIAENQREKHRHHDGRIGRVSPVVEGPGQRLPVEQIFHSRILRD